MVGVGELTRGLNEEEGIYVSIKESSIEEQGREGLGERLELVKRKLSHRKQHL